MTSTMTKTSGQNNTKNNNEFAMRGIRVGYDSSMEPKIQAGTRTHKQVSDRRERETQII